LAGFSAGRLVDVVLLLLVLVLLEALAPPVVVVAPVFDICCVLFTPFGIAELLLLLGPFVALCEFFLPFSLV
jgi:hypothetical protein